MHNSIHSRSLTVLSRSQQVWMSVSIISFIVHSRNVSAKAHSGYGNASFELLSIKIGSTVFLSDERWSLSSTNLFDVGLTLLLSVYNVIANKQPVGCEAQLA